MNKTSTKKIIELTNARMTEEVDNSNNYLAEPSRNVINNILNYSKALSVRKSKNLEHIELVLN